MRVLEDRESKQWIGVLGNSIFHCWMMCVLSCLESPISFPGKFIASTEIFALESRSRKADRNLHTMYRNKITFVLLAL